MSIEFLETKNHKGENLKIQRIGLGTWKAEKNVISEVIYSAIKTGYRHIDCASIYTNEEEVGSGLTRAFKDKLCERKDIWITSKLWNAYHSKEHVKAACQKTLKDLNLDYLDLYLIHFPISSSFVPFNEQSLVWRNKNFKIKLENIPLQETWEAMEDLVKLGLVKNIGVSNFNCQLLQDLLKYAKIKPLFNQVELHPYLVQEKLVKFCDSQNIIITAYSPFGGISYADFGAWKEGDPQPLKDPVILKIANKLNKTPAQIILRWSAQRSKNATVLVKTSNLKRLEENINIFDFELSEDDMKEIHGVDKKLRYNDPGARHSNMFGTFWPVFDD